MRWRHFSCALLFLFASIGLSRADVTFSYVAGQPGETAGATVSTTGGTAAWTAAPGTVLNIPIYLLETVTPTPTNTGNATTSLIDLAFYAPKSSLVSFTGLGSVGVAFVQTGQSGGTAAQIGVASEQVFTPSGAANGLGIPGLANTSGFTFGPQFSGNQLDLTGVGNGGPGMSGTTDLSQIYQNLNNPATGFNNNNVQVVETLAQSTENGGTKTVAKGAITNGATLVNNGTTYVGTGVILIGTVNVTVGTGKTTFQAGPLTMTSSNLVAPTSSTFDPTFDGAKLSSINGALYPAGTFSGQTTAASGSNSSSFIGINAFSNGSTKAIELDIPYPSTTPGTPGNGLFNTTNTLDTFLSVALHGTTSAIAGPSATPAGSSFIPFYGSDASPFTVTVAPATVPEPSSMALCGLLSLGGAFYAARRRRKVVA
jgi:hypothetical protein